ncbi:cyclase family protein [Mycolicibacterium septicum DSM 44393]|uniref:Cyclase family protein n=2 Tax=Mycolicibacterium septicum TaxID=98668 RepID=A0A7X6MN43_9MYCO|nr:cyclase family protein [Mycolicibacterium septicum DSM 44393]
MANLAGPNEVLSAAELVLRGKTFGLDYALDAFTPALGPPRTPPTHTIVSKHRDQRDDLLDGFWLQASSQIDGLRHRRHAEHGFYNGTSDSAINEGEPALGVQHWSNHPIVGRGVVIDVARHRIATGQSIDHKAGEALTCKLLDEVLAAQEVELARGDIILIHTGWAAWYLSSTSAERKTVVESGRRTGMAQSQELLAWIFDHRIALAASDTFAFEALPPVPGSPFGSDTDNGMLHQDLIALLGVPLGELWRLDELAEDCSKDRVYECLLIAKPLNLVGGVGSPANATAIK